MVLLAAVFAVILTQIEKFQAIWFEKRDYTEELSTAIWERIKYVFSLSIEKQNIEEFAFPYISISIIYNT